MKVTNGKRPPEPIVPVSVSLKTASRMLDVAYDTVSDLVKRGVFTALAPKGRGRGKRVFIPTAEVELYGATRDEKAVKEFRKSKAKAQHQRAGEK